MSKCKDLLERESKQSVVCDSVIMVIAENSEAIRCHVNVVLRYTVINTHRCRIP